MGLDDEENLVTYGTPLVTDDNEDEVPRKKPIPIEQQVVTDARGLRRFHGAFTGGFSAGYFNTAGSKEGWAPQSFVSSRSSRAGKSGQLPEDFMDEEDLGAFGIAPRALKVNKDFAVDQSNKTENSRKRHHEIIEGPIPGLPPLRDVIVPVSESMGVQLLKKMGWKPGQGIGPRVNIKEKQRKAKSKVSKALPDVKVYGCSHPDEVDLQDSDADDVQGILFAPDDIDIHGIKAKENWHGLGYVGLDTNPVLSTFREGYRREIPVIDKSRKLAISGEAFGVGAYEEEDANIYTVDDMSQYDFELSVEPSSSSDKIHKSYQQSIGYIGKELEGFHLSSKLVPAKKIFPLPNLPKDFQPFHKSFTAKSHQTEKQQAGGLDRHRMNARDREAIIDDEPPAEGSVFKHLKPEDRIRLQGIRKSNETPYSIPEPESPSKPKETESIWSKFRASSGSSSFKPFAQDEDKQKRYEIYLKLKEAKKEDVFVQCQPTIMTEWEKQREQEEFKRSAEIYRPLSQSMASRFVSEKQPEVTQPLTGLTTVETVVEKSKGKTETIKREIFEWHPDRLLCRRFNIPNPYPESNLVGILKVKRDKYSIFNFLELPEQSQKIPEVSALEESKDENLNDADNAQPSSSKENLKNRPNLFSNLEDDTKFQTPPQSKEPVPNTSKISSEDTRPPMDLFKAIFQDSDSEKDSDTDQDEMQEQPTKIPTKEFSMADIIPKTTNTRDGVRLHTNDIKTLADPFGIFSNLDFDSLNSKSEAPVSLVSGNKKLTSVAVRIEPSAVNSMDSEYYGPSLPPPAAASTSLHHDASRVHSANGTQTLSLKTPKKKSKHKHKKIKKKKHKKSHVNSSEDETSSNEETDLNKKILNKIKKSKRSRH